MGRVGKNGRNSGNPWLIGVDWYELQNCFFGNKTGEIMKLTNFIHYDCFLQNSRKLFSQNSGYVWFCRTEITCRLFDSSNKSCFLKQQHVLLEQGNLCRSDPFLGFISDRKCCGECLPPKVWLTTCSDNESRLSMDAGTRKAPSYTSKLPCGRTMTNPN